MISAQIKGIYTTDGNDLETYIPENLEQFCIVVRILVGPRGTTGEEAFDIKVCTPQWLNQQVEKDGFVIGGRYLVVGGYRPDFVRTLLTRFIERCSGNSWQDVAKKIGRICYWEFDDYPNPE